MQSSEIEKENQKSTRSQSLIHWTEWLPSSMSSVVTFCVMLTLEGRLSATVFRVQVWIQLSNTNQTLGLNQVSTRHLNLQPSNERPFQPFELNMGNKRFRMHFDF